jgi:hypothetical protein
MAFLLKRTLLPRRVRSAPAQRKITRNWIGPLELVIPGVHSVAAGGQGFFVRPAGIQGRVERRA